jgi:hypothetical protein
MILITALLIVRALSQRYGHEGRQFSILQLLVGMTSIAILIVMLRSATMLQRQWAFTVGFIGSNTVIAVGCLFVTRLNHHAVLRLSAAIGTGLLVGWALTVVRPDLSGELQAMEIVQALVVFLWVELGQIANNWHFSTVQSPTDGNQ